MQIFGCTQYTVHADNILYARAVHTVVLVLLLVEVVVLAVAGGGHDGAAVLLGEAGGGGDVGAQRRLPPTRRLVLKRVHALHVAILHGRFENWAPEKEKQSLESKSWAIAVLFNIFSKKNLNFYVFYKGEF